MKHRSFFFIAFLLYAGFADADAIECSGLRHHVDLPQPVVHDGGLGMFIGGYHATACTAWNRFALGGIGIAFGLQSEAIGSDVLRRNALYYLQLPLVDISLMGGGFHQQGDAEPELGTALLREVRYGSWGFRALFSVTWQ